MMKESVTYRGVAYPWQCDFNDHLNVQFYVGKFDEATWHFFSIMGLTKVLLDEEEKMMVAAEQHIQYIREVFSGNLILVKSSLIKTKSKSIVFKHRMMELETMQTVAESMIVSVCIDKVTRKPISLPIL